MTVKLYTAQVCPFAHRTRLALRAKGIEHERVEIDLAAMPDWYLQFSPTGKVPLLEIGDQLIWESALINEFLEEQWPQSPLLPPDPPGRFRARLAVQGAGETIIPAFYQVLRGDKPPAALGEALALLEETMADDGPFWLGERLSLADLAIYPWFERWCVLEHYRQVDRPDGRIGAWMDTMAASGIVQAEQGLDREAYVRSYSRYARPAG